MELLGRIWRQIASMFWESRIEEEIADEMRIHVARLTAYNRRAGLSPEEAARDARRRLGGPWLDRQGRKHRTPQPARYHAA